jgi:hypothetical protein
VYSEYSYKYRDLFFITSRGLNHFMFCQDTKSFSARIICTEPVIITYKMAQSGQSPSLDPPVPVYGAASTVDDPLPSRVNVPAENEQSNLALRQYEPTKAWFLFPFSSYPMSGDISTDIAAVKDVSTSFYQPSSPVYNPVATSTLKSSLDEITTVLLEDLKSLTSRIENDDPLLTTIEPIVATYDYYGWNLLEQDDGQEAFVSLLNALRKKGKTMRRHYRRTSDRCFIRKVVLRSFAAPDIHTMLEAIAAIPTIEELVITDDLEDTVSGNCSNSKTKLTRKRRRSSVGSNTSNGCQYINIDCLTDLLTTVRNISQRSIDEDDRTDDDRNEDDYSEANEIAARSFTAIDTTNNSDSIQQQATGMKQQRHENQDRILAEHEEITKRQGDSNSKTSRASSVTFCGWKVLDIRIRIHVRNLQQIHRFAVEGIGKNMKSLRYISLHFLPRCSIATPTIDFNALIKVLASESVDKRKLTYIEIKLGYNHNPYGRSMVSISSLSQLLLSTSSYNSNLQSIILHNVGISSGHIHMIAELLQLRKPKLLTHYIKEEPISMVAGCNYLKMFNSNNTSIECIDGKESFCTSESALRRLHIVGSLTSSFTDSSLLEVCKSLQAIVQKKLQLIDFEEDNQHFPISNTKDAISNDDSSFIFDQLEHVRFGSIEQIQNIRRSLAFSFDDDNDGIPKKKQKIGNDSPIHFNYNSGASSTNYNNTTEHMFYRFHQQIQHSMRLLRVLKYIVNRKQQQSDKIQINPTQLLFNAICFTNKNIVSKMDYDDKVDGDDDDDIGGEAVISVLFDLIRHNPAMLIS